MKTMSLLCVVCLTVFASLPTLCVLIMFPVIALTGETIHIQAFLAWAGVSVIVAATIAFTVVRVVDERQYVVLLRAANKKGHPIWSGSVWVYPDNMKLSGAEEGGSVVETGNPYQSPRAY